MSTKRPSHSSAKEPFRKLLVSAAQNLHAGDWELNPRDLKLPAGVVWSVRQRALHGGKQEGVTVIEVDNGTLRFTVLPTRGMSVLRVESGDVRLGWDSPVREVVHPHCVNLAGRGGLGWLDGFNEWFVRCGLESMGAPGRDAFTNAAGQPCELDLTLHGKIANLPASEVELIIERAPPYRLRLRGRVDERMLFGPQLELSTELVTEPGALSFSMEDCVTNHAAVAQEFQLLYHVNYGPPLLEAGGRFVGAFRQVTPINAHASKAVKQFSCYAGPVAGFAEEVFCLHPLADAWGQATVLLHNAAADRGAAMTFALEQLPFLTLWKNTGALADGYVTGIEPGTGFPRNRRLEREAGRVPKLAPGESRRFRIAHSLLKGKGAVAVAVDAIGEVQGSRAPRLTSPL